MEGFLFIGASGGGLSVFFLVMACSFWGTMVLRILPLGELDFTSPKRPVPFFWFVALRSCFNADTEAFQKPKNICNMLPLVWNAMFPELAS
mmetsp:Transcript_93544/g.209434  ORF Transcript_93544/g.209434 Transcript_93544/m.209434 type:complete len:91 (+) Transcript_93544:1532-1804(+)